MVKVIKRKGLYRLVEIRTGHIAFRDGYPLDNGGYETREAARDQAMVINAEFHPASGQRQRGRRRRKGR